MYNVVNSSTFKVVDAGEDSGILAEKYDMRKHIIIRSDMPDVKTKKPFTIPIQTQEADYDFSKLSKSKKQTLLAYYHANDLDKVRDIINKGKVAHICCQGQYENMINQIKKAKAENVL